MYKAIDIANYFINKFGSKDDITPMKLVKMVYISHGFYLGLTNGEALIDEYAEAWKYGPVIDTVYQKFKKYGSGIITKPALVPFAEEIEKDAALFLDKMWNTYGKYSAIQLGTMTHQPNTPWHITWYNRGGKNNPGTPIKNDLICRHYKEKINRYSSS